MSMSQISRDGTTQLINTKVTNHNFKNFDTPKKTVTDNVNILGDSFSDEYDSEEEEQYHDKEGGDEIYEKPK